MRIFETFMRKLCANLHEKTFVESRIIFEYEILSNGNYKIAENFQHLRALLSRSLKLRDNSAICSFQ